MDTTDGELETSFGGARHRLGLRSLLASRFSKSLRYRSEAGVRKYRLIAYHCDFEVVVREEGGMLRFFFRVEVFIRSEPGTPTIGNDACNKATLITCHATVVAVFTTGLRALQPRGRT